MNRQLKINRNYRWKKKVYNQYNIMYADPQVKKQIDEQID